MALQTTDLSRPSLHNFCGPVTALKIWSRKILVGCGNEVSVYSLENFQLERRLQILHGACVHGFSQGPCWDDSSCYVCVYGAKQAQIISIQVKDDSLAVLVKVSEVIRLPDWIWEASWVKHLNSEETIAFALAHNTVVLWNYRRNEVIQRQDCTENCILYCAHFIGAEWDNLILAAGTVFNQVVLWLVTDTEHGGADFGHPSAPILHTLSGHKGVIFSIQYHYEYQRLCSASDDRSIRLWQMEFNGGKTPCPTANDWRSLKCSPLLCVFGHSARVWDVVLMSDYFASVGEDSTCCIWDYSGSIIIKFKGHKGKSIWSITASQDEKYIFTGGGDGSVRMWEVNKEQLHSVSEKAIDVSAFSSFIEGDFPRIVTLLNFDTLLVMMNSGSLYSYTMKSQHCKCLFSDPQFVSYTVVSACPDSQKVAVGGISGSLRIVQLKLESTQNSQPVEEVLFDGKVLSLVWMSQDELVASGPHGCCLILKVATEAGEETAMLRIVKDTSLFLPPSKHRWVSAACEIFISGVSQRMIVCGDKDGTIHFYKLFPETDLGSTDGSETFQKPSQSFVKVHGKNGVTCLRFKDGLLYSLGRDGFCRHWTVRNEELEQLHGSKVMKGFDWIDQLEWKNGDTLFYGFLSSEFVIWSQLYNQKLFCVECGGGHRSWSCSHEHGAFRFAYLKGGMVHTVDSAQCFKHRIIKPALHGRELHDVKLLPISSVNDMSPRFLVCSASEDTTLTIGLYHNIGKFTHLTTLATLRGHLSSVRALAVTNLNSELVPRNTSSSNQNSNNLLLFTGGGRAEIRVWKITVNKALTDLEVSEDKSFCDKTQIERAQAESSLLLPVTPSLPASISHQEWSTHYLGEARHKRPYSKWKTRKLQLDPETRVMSLDVSSLQEVRPDVPDAVSQVKADNTSQDMLPNLLILSAAGSDGALRFFAYNTESRKLSPIVQSTFHNGCVLKVIHFVFKSKTKQQFLAFSAATNGKIAIWMMDNVVTRAMEMEWNMKESHEFCRQNHQKASNLNKNLLRNNVERQKVEEERAGSCGLADSFEENEMEAFMPSCIVNAHQSGINSLHALQVNDNNFLLASGGDDNALTVKLIEVNSQDIKEVASFTNENAHGAQITGVHIISDKVLVSTSIDQRICVWSLESHNGDIKLQMLSCAFIHLSDVSCMDAVLQGDSVYLCIGGEGLCLYSWKNHPCEERQQKEVKCAISS